MYSSDDKMINTVFDFYEKSISYISPLMYIQSSNPKSSDNYNYILMELFVYTIAMFIKHERYSAIDLFCDEQFYYENLYGRDSSPYTIFCNNIESLDVDRNNELNLRRISVTADLIKERSNNSYVHFDEYMQSDFILFLRSVINPLDNTFYDFWRPKSLVYGERTQFDLFYRAQSKRYFSRLKKLLKVNRKDDLINKFQTARNNYQIESLNKGHTRLNYERMMNFEKLDTL